MQRRGKVRAILAVIVVAAAALAFAWPAWQRVKARDAGRAMYLGTADLAGRVPGHAEMLPTMATQCVNCHGAPGAQPVAAPQIGGAPAAALESRAPQFDRMNLTRTLSRRGGPASRYDASTLCNLLRTGIDPTQIVISTTMPRYDISDGQCRQLWAFLTDR